MAKKYYYEGEVILAPFTIASNRPVYDVDTVSLIKQRATQSAQRWELRFSTVSTETVNRFINAIDEVTTTHTFIMPQFMSVVEARTVTTSPNLDSAASAGVSSVVLDTGASFGFLPKGSFIKFSNHDKVYVTTADADFSSGSSTTVSIFPELKKPVATTDTLLSGDDCVLTYYKDTNNIQGITFSDGILVSGTISLIEALS